MKDIPEITGMRGYASQAVIVYHFLVINNFLSWLSLSKIAYTWNSGVDFFFVLSGFLLTVPFIEASQNGSRQSLKEYYLKRVFRILPAYYVSILLAVAIISRHATLHQIVTSMFFLQSFSQSTFNSINGVSWTLVVEEIFYATLPVFSLLFVKKRWIYALPACAAVTILYRFVVFSLYGQNSSDLHFFMWQYPSFLVHYAIGAALANLYVNRPHLIRPRSRLAASIPMLSSILVLLITQYLIGSVYGGAYDVKVFPAIIFAVEYGALIYTTIVSPPGAFLRRLFTQRAALFTGKISYSVYSIHLPVIEALAALRLPLVEWIAASYTLVFLGSTAIHYFVERPFLKLRSKVLGHLKHRVKGQEVSQAVSMR